MIYCKDCKYFDPHRWPPNEWMGVCEIVLPPWVPILETNSRCVRDDDGCSLGTHRVPVLLSPI